MPNNRNDQARAHLQAGESAEEQHENITGEVLPKIKGNPN
jgi:hypothetical protein